MKFLIVVILSLIALTFAQGDLLCQPCQLGVQLIKDFAAKPDEELLAMLLKQCDRLPEQARPPCKLALSLVGRQIITYVRANLQQPNKAICHRFRLCRTPTEEIEIVADAAQDTPLCAPCQLAINLIKQYANQPDEELLKMLMNGCNALPEAVQAPCKMAVTLVGPQLIAYVKSHLREEPRAICARFRLCAAQELVDGSQDTPLCGPCQLGVQLVKDFANRPDDELLDMLNKGCEALPEAVQAPCKMAVMLVGKQMIVYIRSHLRESNRLICANFRLCGRSQESIDEKNKFKCVLKCLGSGWNLQRVIKLVAKCKTNTACYVKEVGQTAADCIKKCL